MHQLNQFLALGAFFPVGGLPLVIGSIEIHHVLILRADGIRHPLLGVIDIPVGLERHDGGILGLDDAHILQHFDKGVRRLFNARGPEHIHIHKPAFAGIINGLHADDGVARAVRIAHVVQIRIGFQILLQVGHIVQILVEVQQHARVAVLGHHAHHVGNGQNIRNLAGGQHQLGFFLIVGIGGKFIVDIDVADVFFPGLDAGQFRVLILAGVGIAMEGHFFAGIGEGNGGFLRAGHAAHGREQQRRTQNQGQGSFHGFSSFII